VRGQVVFETRSAVSGRIRVIDREGERRLVVNGAILSAIPRDGDWRRVRHEYWWRALVAVPLPARPSALLIGLGGGTQVHMLHALRRPRAITVIERDPTIVRVACEWFGLDRVRRLEVLCGEAESALEGLSRTRRRFNFVMEDAAYDGPSAPALALARAAADVVAPGGALVVNRHRRDDAAALVAALVPSFASVRQRRVRREAENVLVCATGRRRQPVRRRV
jgi:spermidine synthase